MYLPPCWKGTQWLRWPESDKCHLEGPCILRLPVGSPRFVEEASPQDSHRKGRSGDGSRAHLVFGWFRFELILPF